eukprot:934558-Amphidinium_carterae.1
MRKDRLSLFVIKGNFHYFTCFLFFLLSGVDVTNLKRVIGLGFEAHEEHELRWVEYAEVVSKADE